MSVESSPNPVLPYWEPVVGEASHGTYDTADKRDSIRSSQIKKGSLGIIHKLFVRMLSLFMRYLPNDHFVELNASGCHEGLSYEPSAAFHEVERIDSVWL